MFDYEELLAVAYKNERVSSRRLVKGAGLSEHEALRTILAKAAGERSLRELVQTRRDTQAKAEKARSERQEKRASRPVKDQEEHAADLWRGGFDGSALPNPGRIGIGGWLRSPCGACFEISATAGRGDSSAAEYLALIALLETALREGARKVSIQGDSRVVIDDMLASGKAGIRSLTHHAARARALIDAIGDVRLRWVPRQRNAHADELSRRVLDQLAANSRTSAVGFSPNESPSR